MPPPSCQIQDLVDGFLPAALAATSTAGPRGHGMVWRRTIAGRQQTVFGLLDPAGNLVTPPGPVDITDANNQNVQDVSLVWTGNEFAAAWWLPTVGAVFQRIDRSGRRIGNNVVIGGAGQPSLAYNPRDREFVVAWRGSLQRLDASGRLIGAPLRNASSGRASIAWSAPLGQYVHLSVAGPILEHRLFDAAGQEISMRPLYMPPMGFRIDDNAGNTLLPMVYNHADHELAVAFRLKPSTGGTLYDASIHLLVFEPAGMQLALREVAPQAPRGLLEPGLVWSGAGYGVAWTGHINPYPVTVLHTDRRGAPLSRVRDVACQRGNRSIYPTLAFNGASYIAMWNMPWRVFSTVWTP